MALAETSVSLFERTGLPVYEEAIRRWGRVVEESTPAGGGRGEYAEHYGRCIHFLLEAARALGDYAFRIQAQLLAAEAVSHLYAGPMWRSHPGEDCYDAVDGAGMLFLALVYLQTGRDPAGMGFGF